MRSTCEKGRRARLRWALATLGVLAVGACTTPYQPKGAMGGFSDRKLGPGQYTVEFSGNGNTSADLVANMYLYRCAELTVKDGYDVFRSADPQSPGAGGWMQPMADVAGNGTAAPTDFRSGGGGTVRTVPIYVPSTTTVTIRRMTGVVRMGRYADVPSNVRVWDARAVLKQLDGVVKAPSPKALRPEEIAKVAMVNGRGRATSTTSTTSLDDLRQLLSQPQD